MRAVVLVAVGVFLMAVVVASTRGPGGAAPPATGAAGVVPADALAYVHLSTDESRPGVERALAVAARFPNYPLLAARLAGVRPWLGKEAALALLDTPAGTARLIVLDVANRAGARAFLRRRGIALGAGAAFVGHYLVLGPADAVRAAIDVGGGRAPSLASDGTYRRAAASEAPGRVLDAYVSAAGVRQVLIDRGGIAAALGMLLYQPALSGVAVSVSAAPPGARLLVHTVLDPSLERISGVKARWFTPTLEGELPAGSTLALDVSGLARTAPHVLAAAGADGIGGGIGPLLARLGTALRAEGVNVAALVRLFSGETAVAIVPGAGRGRPALVIVTRTSNMPAVRAQLAALEVPLAQLFQNSTPGSVQPVFSQRQVDGITAHQLPLATGLQLDYAVFRGLVVVSTSLGGIAAVATDRHTLATTPAYRATLAGRPSRVTSLLFLDFRALLSLGEQTGLTRGALFSALRSDLQRVRAVGLASTSGEADSTSELSLQIP
jgi:hypothetical protein